MKPAKLSLLAAVLVAAALNGCSSRHVVVRERVATPVVVRERVATPVVVVRPPPAPRVEVVGVAPSPNHVWAPGYWSWSNNRYTWVPGRWEVRPHQQAKYVQGHWEKERNGWVYYEGHWQ